MSGFTIKLKEPKDARVVVIDDNSMNLLLLCLVLEREGYNVIRATSGEEGMEIVRNELPHAVVSDVSMPGLNGLQLTMMIKANPKTKHVPVILVSAFAMKTEIEQALAAGCDDYVTKPINNQQFADTVRKHLKFAEAAV